MKQVLIIGIGFQGKKYVSYFLNKGYKVDGVSKSGINKNNIVGIRKIYKSDIIFSNIYKYINLYDYIVLSVKPYDDLEYIVEKILNINYKGKVIIEKPVSYNLFLLEKLYYKSNFYFFIDELCLNYFYSKIINNRFVDISFILYCDKNSDCINIIEHIFGGFLLNKNLINILKNTKIIFSKPLFDNYDLKYSILLDRKYLITFDKGNIFINSKKFITITFYKSIDFILGLSLEMNQIYKNNFFELRKYTNDKF